MPTSTTLLSILGLEHSGTTLLVRILNNHDDAAAVGGIKNVTDFAVGKRACSCGEPSGACGFWEALAGEFSRRGRRLDQVSTAIKERDARVIRDFFEAAAGSTGKSLIIESSRQPSYLALLPGPPDFAPAAVHIFKHPGAQAWSAYREGRSVFREMRHYRRRSLAVHRSLSGHPASMHVSHEDFCTAPEKHLRRILGLAKRQPGEGQLETWGSKEMHIIGGNRMKKDSSSVVKNDGAWRRSLPLAHRFIARLIGGAAYRKNLAASRG